jgi:hypothetical protein
LLVAGVFAAFSICIHAYAQIGPTEVRFRDELGGKPLPPATDFLLGYRTIFLLVAIFLPLAAIATFAFRDRTQACWALAGLALGLVFEWLLIYEALRIPFIQIMKTMSGSSGN